MFLKHKTIHPVESDVLEYKQKIHPFENQRGFMLIKQMHHYTLYPGPHQAQSWSWGSVYQQ